MTRKTLTLATAALAAASLVLSACGSSSTKSGGGGKSGTVASKLILGGPPEFKTRVDGVPGLSKVYGVDFQAFKTLDTGGPVTVTSLKNGQVDAADLFTTDPAIKANDFVVLTDPKSNFGAQNVLPLINKSKATAGVKQVLNFISSKLTTDDLIALRTKVEVDKQDPDVAAKAYLQSISPPTTTPAQGVSITVGSANFPENVILADIYADALQAAGAKVTKKLNIGSREKYIPGLQDGSIDLIPEYSGVLLQYFDKKATATASDAVYSALQKAVPAKLTVLDQSKAEDADAIVVTKKTADKYGLTSIADLAKPAKS
jgi:glycine betaine/choline ABC-type transport system substrate-binding protein